MSNPKPPTILNKLATKLGIRSDKTTALDDSVGQHLSTVLEDHLEMIAAAHTDIHNSAHFSKPSPN